jgi:hypothetical protein
MDFGKEREKKKKKKKEEEEEATSSPHDLQYPIDMLSFQSSSKI